MTNKFEVLELFDNLVYVTNDSFIVGIDDKKHKFGVLFEIMNTRNFDDNPDNKYPFVVSVGIIADDPDQYFLDDCYEGLEVTKLNKIEACNTYIGSIPIDHILTDSINGGMEELKTLFKIDEATLKSREVTRGTVAAQRGNIKFSWLQFKDEKTCEKFIEFIKDTRLNVLSTMIGFILDQPINTIGDTGWSNFTKMIKYK